MKIAQPESLRMRVTLAAGSQEAALNTGSARVGGFGPRLMNKFGLPIRDDRSTFTPLGEKRSHFDRPYRDGPRSFSLSQQIITGLLSLRPSRTALGIRKEAFWTGLLSFNRSTMTYMTNIGQRSSNDEGR
jgi:hypothetical protein